jgi:hypothetical protein
LNRVQRTKDLPTYHQFYRLVSSKSSQAVELTAVPFQCVISVKNLHWLSNDPGFHDVHETGSTPKVKTSEKAVRQHPLQSKILGVIQIFQLFLHLLLWMQTLGNAMLHLLLHVRNGLCDSHNSHTYPNHLTIWPFWGPK